MLAVHCPWTVDGGRWTVCLLVGERVTAASGQKQPLGYLCKSWALHSTKKSSRVEICVYTLTVQKSGLAFGLWCICHAVLLKLEHRFCLASITQKPYF